MTLIAERRWFAVAPDGEEFDLIIRLGQPYPATNASWACPLTLEGLHKKLPDIHGIDSLQAIELAMKLAADLVCSFAEKGGKIFWSRDGDQVSLITSLPFAETFISNRK